MSKITMSVSDVSVTALADVIRTGYVTEVVADKMTHGRCTVTVAAPSGETLNHLLRALSAPHEPRKMLAAKDLAPSGGPTGGTPNV